MFDHVTIRVADRAVSERFYETLLPVVGFDAPRGEVFDDWGEFSFAEASPEKPVTRRLHMALFAPSREIVDEFWRVGTEAGYRDDGEPGPRPQYSDTYYGAFLLDPDGNSVEAVHHDSQKPLPAIDHLWIRVRDVAASKRFYETVAPYTGFTVAGDLPDLVRFAQNGTSFSLVAGEPTENVHLAFAADDDATVGEFHATALQAGYRDEGPPGERPVYHPGYYGAFVLDPDGNNVEVVNHNR